MKALRQFLKRVRTAGLRRAAAVRTTAMGRERVFDAYDLGADTVILERGIASHLGERPSVLIVEKRALGRRGRGRVFTITTGNHSVAAFPLLDGRFWKLSALPSDRRSDVLTHSILCANIVDAALEISQREISTADLVAADEWLQKVAGFGRPDVVMLERNDATLEHYRHLGEEWRVKPLAWTETEMRVALAASRKRIASKLRYYHCSRGVHLLSYQEFSRFAALAETEPDEFLKGMRELVSVYEGNASSFTRMPKYHGHHEVEFFGLRRGLALERLIPELEKLMEAVVLGRIGRLGIIQKIQEIVALYRSLLTKPELADDSTKLFTETIYMYVTGEIYAVQGEGSTPAFDDRRTALPGATFVGGRPELHPGADERTEVLMSNLRGMMSKDEIIEYANVYELRGGDGVEAPLGEGSTREIVYKTNRRPLEASLIEKRLSHAGPGYTGYMLARIGALRGLGIGMSDYYRILRRRAGQRGRRGCDFYIRRRCEGEPMESIPANYFRDMAGTGAEVKEVVLGLATLMGDAAAQNLAMKKYDAKTETPLYGIGKEIYEFEYDITRERVVPKRVSTCSIRGSFGWPCRDFTDENLSAIANFYFGHFAHAVKLYAAAHPSVTMAEVAERFMGGFEFRTHALCWQLSVMRDEFEAFSPDVPKQYDFTAKWRFALWALERHERRLPVLRSLFFRKVALVAGEES